MVDAPSARTRFQQKVREIVNGQDEFVAADVTDQALAAMRAEDPKFDAAFTDELAGLMAYESTLRAVGESRKPSIFKSGTSCASARWAPVNGCSAGSSMLGTATCGSARCSGPRR